MCFGIFQVERLLVPVTFNILLTLIVWIGVYETKTDSNSVFYYMLDPRHNRTTGNEIVDGMVRALRSHIWPSVCLSYKFPIKQSLSALLGSIGRRDG